MPLWLQLLLAMLVVVLLVRLPRLLLLLGQQHRVLGLDLLRSALVLAVSGPLLHGGGSVL